MVLLKWFIEKVKLYAKLPDEKSSEEKLKETISNTLIYLSIFIFCSNFFNIVMLYLLVRPSQLEEYEIYNGIFNNFYEELKKNDNAMSVLISYLIFYPMFLIVSYSFLWLLFSFCQLIFAKIFSLKLTFQDLFKIAIFSATPLHLSAFFLWLPSIGPLIVFLAFLSSLSYMIKTIQMITNIDEWKATLIVIAPIIILVILSKIYGEKKRKSFR
jgi:hypothetical protein